MVIKSVLLPGLRKALSDIVCLAHAGCLFIRSESEGFLLVPSAPHPADQAGLLFFCPSVSRC